MNLRLAYTNGFDEPNGVLILSILNVIAIILLQDSIDPNLAGLSVSLTTSFIGLTSFWSKSVVEVGNFMTAPQRIL